MSVFQVRYFTSNYLKNDYENMKLRCKQYAHVFIFVLARHWIKLLFMLFRHFLIASSYTKGRRTRDVYNTPVSVASLFLFQRTVYLVICLTTLITAITLLTSIKCIDHELIISKFLRSWHLPRLEFTITSQHRPRISSHRSSIDF